MDLGQEHEGGGQIDEGGRLKASGLSISLKPLGETAQVSVRWNMSEGNVERLDVSVFSCYLTSVCPTETAKLRADRRSSRTLMHLHPSARGATIYRESNANQCQCCETPACCRTGPPSINSYNLGKFRRARHSEHIG
ncbi:hypothetical protein AOLI_G00223410 [Acnodon oligacanthus]